MMKKCIRLLKPYCSVFMMRFRIETQYRGAALGGIITQVFFGLMLIALYTTLYQSAPQTVPLAQTVTYVWLQQSCFRMLLSTDSELMQTVRTGGMAYEMCRPLSPYGFYYARAMAQKLVGSTLRALPMLLIAFLLPAPWGISLPAGIWQLIMFLAALFLGLLCTCALSNIAMAFTIRSLDMSGITSAMNLMLVTFCGNLLPLTLFPDKWQKFIRLTPYAQLLDAPIRIYTGEYTFLQSAETIGIQLFWTCALITLGYFMWQSNQKKMIVQGG